MKVVKLSDLSDQAVEIVDRAMRGEEFRVINDVTRMVISGGSMNLFPLDDIDDGTSDEFIPVEGPVRD